MTEENNKPTPDETQQAAPELTAAEPAADQDLPDSADEGDSDAPDFVAEDAIPADTEEATPLRPRKVMLLAILAITIIVLDLATKIIAVATLSESTPGSEQPRILGGAVYFSLIRNPGAAFSLATSMTWILALVMLAVIIAIIRYATRLRSARWAVALGLILGGASGNFIDRVFRSPGFFRGHVVDFVSVFGPNAEYFPVFNVADSAISIGGVLLVATALFGVDFDGTKIDSKQRSEQAAAHKAAKAAQKNKKNQKEISQ